MMIVFYTTEGCSLCDQALDMMITTPQLSGNNLHAVDIAFDDELLEQYAEKIPVVSVAGITLLWPFTVQEIVNLIEKEL